MLVVILWAWRAQLVDTVWGKIEWAGVRYSRRGEEVGTWGGGLVYLIEACGPWKPGPPVGFCDFQIYVRDQDTPRAKSCWRTASGAMVVLWQNWQLLYQSD